HATTSKYCVCYLLCEAAAPHLRSFPTRRSSDLVSRGEKLGSRVRPVACRRKPTITCPRVSRLHFVIFRPVVEGDDNPYGVPVLRAWSWLYSNFECQVSLGVWIGSL